MSQFFCSFTLSCRNHPVGDPGPLCNHLTGVEMLVKPTSSIVKVTIKTMLVVFKFIQGLRSVIAYCNMNKKQTQIFYLWVLSSCLKLLLITCLCPIPHLRGVPSIIQTTRNKHKDLPTHTSTHYQTTQNISTGMLEVKTKGLLNQFTRLKPKLLICFSRLFFIMVHGVGEPLSASKVYG